MDVDWDEHEVLDDDALLMSSMEPLPVEDTPSQVESCASKNQLPQTPDSGEATEVDDQDDFIISREVPVHSFRSGYIWVSDMSSQSWCEMQMEYSFTLPTTVVENPLMTAGSDIHLARELEVHDKVQVSVSSREDAFAVKILNLMSQMDALTLGAPVIREVPIFGTPFNLDIFVMGVIDEIRCDPITMQCDIFELKTRGTNTLPSKAQKTSHDIQVMLYKRLFDDLIISPSVKDMITLHLGHDLKKQLGPGITENMKVSHDQVHNNLDSMLESLSEKAKRLTLISQVFVEYCFQKDKKTIGIETVNYDESWLENKFTYFAKYWKGERLAVGVDIEDAWKCQRCDFAEVCEWRQSKAEECAEQNRRRKPINF